MKFWKDRVARYSVDPTPDSAVQSTFQTIADLWERKPPLHGEEFFLGRRKPCEIQSRGRRRQQGRGRRSPRMAAKGTHTPFPATGKQIADFEAENRLKRLVLPSCFYQ
jgi:hypothetical protein